MVVRNNAGRLGAGFISVCLKTRWLGHFGGFYVPEPYQNPTVLVFPRHAKKNDLARRPRLLDSLCCLKSLCFADCIK